MQSERHNYALTTALYTYMCMANPFNVRYWSMELNDED